VGFLPVMLASGQNLVPNWSFEDTTSCPTYVDDISNATGWSSFSQSPDYFNPCANVQTPYVGSPNNAVGHQQAFNGNCYAGIATYAPIFPTSYREYIGVHLIQSLQVGVKYYVLARFSRADSAGNDCATDNLGFRFTTNEFNELHPLPVDNFSHIHTDSIIKNKTGWTTIRGSFTADSSYQYLVIGNFYVDSLTDTFECAHTGQYLAYYYVDGVCVSTDSLTSENWTSVEYKNENAQIGFYPNPANDVVSVLGINQSYTYLVADILGRQIIRGTLDVKSPRINFSNIQSGIYFIELGNARQFKIIINH